MPAIVPVVLVLLAYWLLSKNLSIQPRLFGYFLVLSILMYSLNILAVL